MWAELKRKRDLRAKKERLWDSIRSGRSREDNSALVRSNIDNEDVQIIRNSYWQEKSNMIVSSRTSEHTCLRLGQGTRSRFGFWNWHRKEPKPAIKFCNRISFLGWNQNWQSVCGTWTARNENRRSSFRFRMARSRIPFLGSGTETAKNWAPPLILEPKTQGTGSSNSNGEPN